MDTRPQAPVRLDAPSVMRALGRSMVGALVALGAVLYLLGYALYLEVRGLLRGR